MVAVDTHELVGEALKPMTTLNRIQSAIYPEVFGCDENVPSALRVSGRGNRCPCDYPRVTNNDAEETGEWHKTIHIAQRNVPAFSVVRDAEGKQLVFMLRSRSSRATRG